MMIIFIINIHFIEPYEFNRFQPCYASWVKTYFWDATLSFKFLSMSSTTVKIGIQIA